MMQNQDSQFIINLCCCAEEEEYSDDEGAKEEQDNELASQGNEMEEIRKKSKLDYAVLFEQEAMSIN
jgi:hypothetical protein